MTCEGTRYCDDHNDWRNHIGALPRCVCSETTPLLEAKSRLDSLDFYPNPVRIEGVRIRVWPWFFRWFFPQFDGLTWSRRTIIMRDLAPSEDLLTHELCHVWQTQNDGWLRTSWAYVRYPYRDNPYEAEARLAVTLSR